MGGNLANHLPLFAALIESSTNAAFAIIALPSCLPKFYASVKCLKTLPSLLYKTGFFE